MSVSDGNADAVAQTSGRGFYSTLTRYSFLVESYNLWVSWVPGRECGQNVGRTWTECTHKELTASCRVRSVWCNPKWFQILDNMNGNARLSQSCSVEGWCLVLTCDSFVSISAAGRDVLQMPFFSKGLSARRRCANVPGLDELMLTKKRLAHMYIYIYMCTSACGRPYNIYECP